MQLLPRLSGVHMKFLLKPLVKETLVFVANGKSDFIDRQVRVTQQIYHLFHALLRLQFFEGGAGVLLDEAAQRGCRVPGAAG
ncbi:MAG: hypothetical protein LUG44_06125 [Clostridiales bacterium]|nr:hypothetical protein [Clostridiales bacterium]